MIFLLIQILQQCDPLLVSEPTLSHLVGGDGLVEALPKKCKNVANPSFISGLPSSLLLFLDLLGMKQRDAGLGPAHLLSVTLLIFIAMHYSFLSISSVSKFVMYEEQFVL